MTFSFLFKDKGNIGTIRKKVIKKSHRNFRWMHNNTGETKILL